MVCVGRGGAIPEVVHQSFIRQNFCPNCMKTKEIGRGGGEASLAPSREGEIFNPPPFTVADPGFLGLGRGKFMTPFHQPIAYHEI